MMLFNDIVVNWVERVTIVGVPGNTKEEILKNLENHDFADMIDSDDVGLFLDNPELEIFNTYEEE